ncbi:MAG: hypothetical protein R3B94_09780 [Hyphomonas sp.]
MRACLLALGFLVAACAEPSSDAARSPASTSDADAESPSGPNGARIYVKCNYTDGAGRTGTTFYRIDERRRAIAWWFDDLERTDVPRWDESGCDDDNRECDFQATMIEQNWSAGEWGSSLHFNRVSGDYSYSQWNGDSGFIREGHCEPSGDPADEISKKF